MALIGMIVQNAMNLPIEKNILIYWIIRWHVSALQDIMMLVKQNARIVIIDGFNFMRKFI